MTRWWAAVGVVAAFGCGTPDADRDPIEQDLQALLDSAWAAAPTAPGIMLRVEAPGRDLIWTGAVGYADRAAGVPLDPGMVVRIASNTKTYIAATVLRLAETGRIAVDSPAARYLEPASVARLRGDGYDTRAITVRHLLTHTAGLFDYAMSPQYAAAAFADLGHRWTRAEQLGFAVDSGAPVGGPGERFHYTDTGYILLGELIEKVTGESMGAAVRRLLKFDSLGIRTTWFETLDPAPADAPPRAHQYIDSVDTYGADPSLDLYGGGGLAATLEDMARFYRALVRGAVFDRPETLAMMLEVTPQSTGNRPGGYGMGIGRGEEAGLVCYGHSGFWGTVARHCPDADLTITAAVNQASEPTGALGKLVAAVVARLGAAPTP